MTVRPASCATASCWPPPKRSASRASSTASGRCLSRPGNCPSMRSTTACARPTRCWPRSSMSPMRMTRGCSCRPAATRCRCRCSRRRPAQRRRHGSRWRWPMWPTRRGSWPAARRTTCANALPAHAPTDRIAGISSSIIARTRPAPSSPRLSMTARCWPSTAAASAQPPATGCTVTAATGGCASSTCRIRSACCTRPSPRISASCIRRMNTR